MRISVAAQLGVLYLLSEMGLAVFKRAKAGEASIADQGSLRLLWMVIVSCVFAAYGLALWLPELRTALQAPFIDAGIVVFAAGIALRWYSIVYLGRFFTVNVAIAADHELIDTGPYRYIRHPSYTGALMAFLGLGLCLCNWASIAAMVIPTSLVFLRRIRIEEAALAQGLGGAYRDYMRRTKRLIPGLY
jgi:protein-S-isoprenylcysteine O-methyltransferase